MKLIDGKLVSAQIKAQIAQEVAILKKEGKKTPHLAAILVGDDGASQTYVASKVRFCQEVGYDSTLIQKPADLSEAELLALVESLNHNAEIDGFIVQLPLPAHISAEKVLLAIDPKKDVDGFHPENVGRMLLGLPCYLPATPLGILKLLEYYQIPTAGRHCVVVGRSHIVGSPMSVLMARNAPIGNATVTLTHSRTADLAAITRQADILIAALGKPEFITAEMVKEGAVVIDVGTTRVADASKKSGFSLKGDVKFDEVAPKCSYISPVPGGVGLLTVTALMLNTLQAVTNRF
ncbi:bifunctional 5,10-methylenetetrahydrofolate dehydrogenase/5,10-methenyltetrahydrofolate cyclohydrolase [Hugenholtzia roseola]|uniref:bifunctional 5,10-methylenetetrahydrofolate dehydrogenase/5,10-methenyltetrahydrofolate cyclohydrolase n=1 Tax=Hugenholtzia roseola TaxID=1002 RepID=UPI00041427A3|nr:tetrahydrofolate dehydrogenase/cyclohydrolase catalytic domain-containing protein [Hugenholtzia roseola]